ncbi:MAG: energy transducer TonB [Candidatus Brocadiaceae bacterium]
MLKGFILALCIHGVLFFMGGKYFVKPVQYSIQSTNGSIDVDLVTATPQSDADTVKSITPITGKQPETVKLTQPDVDTVKPIVPATEKKQEAVKIMPQEEPVTLPKSDLDAVRPITPTMEEQLEVVKIAPQEKPVTLPQPDKDAAKSIAPTTEKRLDTAKTMSHPSQGTAGTKSKPGYLRNQPPEYPQLAKQLHQEGLVLLRVEIDQKGIPVKVEVVQGSGYQLLDQAALKAVRHWRFQPERRGDMPVESRVTIPIRFRLE